LGRWTAAEDALLIRHYPISGTAGVQLLTLRSTSAVITRAKILRNRGVVLNMAERNIDMFNPKIYPIVPYHVRVSDRVQRYPKPPNTLTDIPD